MERQCALTHTRTDKHSALRTQTPTQAVAFSPDGRWLVVGGARMNDFGGARKDEGLKNEFGVRVYDLLLSRQV